MMTNLKKIPFESKILHISSRSKFVALCIFWPEFLRKRKEKKLKTKLGLRFHSKLDCSNQRNTNLSLRFFQEMRSFIHKSVK